MICLNSSGRRQVCCAQEEQSSIGCTGGTQHPQICKPEVAVSAEHRSEGHPTSRQHPERNTAEADVVRATVAWSRGASME